MIYGACNKFDAGSTSGFSEKYIFWFSYTKKRVSDHKKFPIATFFKFTLMDSKIFFVYNLCGFENVQILTSNDPKSLYFGSDVPGNHFLGTTGPNASFRHIISPGLKIFGS